jgi:hypothetical protein
MFLLRIGNLGRWPSDRDVLRADAVAKAAADLTLRARDSGLSVFRVAGAVESTDVALRHALTCRDEPRNIDYVVFPSELPTALRLSVVPAPTTDLEPYLSERHEEILGLTPELSLKLAEAILADGRWRTERIARADLESAGAELCRRDPGLKDHIHPGMIKKLPGLMGEPKTGG